jgi:hypothetical protein
LQKKQTREMKAVLIKERSAHDATNAAFTTLRGDINARVKSAVGDSEKAVTDATKAAAASDAALASLRSELIDAHRDGDAAASAAASLSDELKAMKKDVNAAEAAARAAKGEMAAAAVLAAAEHERTVAGEIGCK